MRALAPTLVPTFVLLVVVLGGCGRTAAPAGPGIEARTPIAPEERSTCEALGRVDLAVVGTDPARLAPSARALERAGARAPADVGPALVTLAKAYRRSPAAARQDPRRSVVIAWFNQRCGGFR